MVGLMLTGTAVAAELPSDVPVLSPDELKDYKFNRDQEQETPTVEELSVGQKYVLDAQRREIKDLIATKLGVMELKGDKRDLDTIQKMVDRNVLRDDQVKQWQSLGVIFGDVLAKEMDLHWVSYTDKQGTSKALQWRDSMNFVFPVTVFSKRVAFGVDIDIHEIYDKIRKDVGKFSDVEKAGARTKS